MTPQPLTSFTPTIPTSTPSLDLIIHLHDVQFWVSYLLPSCINYSKFVIHTDPDLHFHHNPASALFSSSLLESFWLHFFPDVLLSLGSQLSSAFAYPLKFPTDLELAIASSMGCSAARESCTDWACHKFMLLYFNRAVISAQHFFYSSLADSLLIPHSSFSKHF